MKAYEFGEGEYVHVTDEDLQAAEGETYRTVELGDFVPYEEIDPIYFERTYYLVPADGAAKVYALLLRAMDESGLCGIGKLRELEKRAKDAGLTGYSRMSKQELVEALEAA